MSSYSLNTRFRNLESFAYIYSREFRQGSPRESLNFSRHGCDPRSSLPDACDHSSSAGETCSSFVSD